MTTEEDTMTDTRTDAQAAALDEAIEAAHEALSLVFADDAQCMDAASSVVRAVWPILLRQAEAERDALARLLEAATTAGEAFRARLADAERDALNRAADEIEAQAAKYVPSRDPEDSVYAAGLRLAARIARERAKAAGAAQAEPGEEW